MIDKEKFHVLNYVKKEEYSASMDGMRYMLKKKGRRGRLQAGGYYLAGALLLCKDAGREKTADGISLYAGRCLTGSAVAE